MTAEISMMEQEISDMEGVEEVLSTKLNL